MKITLCGSCKFEKGYKFWNELLTLRSHIVYSVAVLPSDKEGEKHWYTATQKRDLDLVHLKKISQSDAILVVSQDPVANGELMQSSNGYIGESTRSEILWARLNNKIVIYDHTMNVPYLVEMAEKGVMARGQDL